MAAQNEMDRAVTIATFQTLRQRKRLMALLAGEPFSAIFVDESHHPETARQWRKILLELREWNLGSFLVGFSATPRPRKPIDDRYLFNATVDQHSVQ